MKPTGDIHFRLADDEGHFIVCEIVPYHPLQAPKLGERVTVEGIHRYDNEVGHGFHEIHPVEQWYPAREKGDGSQGHQVHVPSPLGALRQSITPFRFQDSLATSAVNPHTRSHLSVMTKGIGAPLLVHVADVIDLCAEEEMGGVHAVAVVAAVEDEQAVWDWAVRELPCNSICVCSYAFTPFPITAAALKVKVNSTPTIAVRGAKPRPAIVGA